VSHSIAKSHSHVSSVTVASTSSLFVNFSIFGLKAKKCTFQDAPTVQPSDFCSLFSTCSSGFLKIKLKLETIKRMRSNETYKRYNFHMFSLQSSSTDWLLVDSEVTFDVTSLILLLIFFPKPFYENVSFLSCLQILVHLLSLPLVVYFSEDFMCLHDFTHTHTQTHIHTNTHTHTHTHTHTYTHIHTHTHNTHTHTLLRKKLVWPVNNFASSLE
jgi:hypothetical protein